MGRDSVNMLFPSSVNRLSIYVCTICTVGWSDFIFKKIGTRKVVPKFRNQIPKFHYEMLFFYLAQRQIFLTFFVIKLVEIFLTGSNVPVFEHRKKCNITPP